MSAAYNASRYATEDGFDWCSRTGAIQLKERIEAYWRLKGCEVKIDVVTPTFLPSLGRSRYDVRSNMTGGFPLDFSRAKSDKRA